MNNAPNHSWPEANQRYLMASLALVRAALQRYAGTGSAEHADDENLYAALDDAAAAMPGPSALDTLCARLGLSSFERDVLLLCAGIELDGTMVALCAAAHGDAARCYPTFSLALAALPDPEWEALTPIGALRHWRLIEVGAGPALTLSPLRIDERILHYLAGVQHLDDRLVGIVEPLGMTAMELVPSHSALADRIAETWSRTSLQHLWPVVQIVGDEAESRTGIALEAASRLGLSLCAIQARAIPSAPAELDGLIRLWERESALRGSALLIECDDDDAPAAASAASPVWLADGVHGPVMISVRERLRGLRRPSIGFDARRPHSDEQRQLWHETLGESAAAMNGEIDRLVAQFNLGATAIRSACAGASDTDRLWDACRDQARPGLENLAQWIEPKAGWDDLVLPQQQLKVLRRIAVHLRQKSVVYGKWGFGARSSRGLGISALFAGASGTGKTMAAEVLARELRLDLFRIDLSSVVSKYIGETEKNLRRLFDAAEDGGAILFFDEADALFGKRTEVKDSHDRYANIEVSYLLQRMESYCGLAILTTNMRNALDTAFLRRIRFIVDFPFPDITQRMEIWRRAFPAGTPVEGLDISRLARLNVAGGNITNIALCAAFLAAEADEPVRMKHLRDAARDEYAKLERSLTEAEIGGWV